MKKIIVLFTILLSAAFAASAQTPTLERNGRFLTVNGQVVSDEEIQSIISPSVYSETYEGARKQAIAGRKLRIGGFIGMGVGMAAMIGTASTMYDYYESDDIESVEPGVVLTYLSGALLLAAGATCVEASIPLSIIGKKRLDWVAEDYNSGNHASKVTFDFGAQQHGFGLALKF